MTHDPDRLLDAESHATGEAEAIWAWMRAEAPVHRHQDTACGPLVSVTRYADVHSVYRDHATFSSKTGVILRPRDAGEDPGRGMALALTDPPRHRGLRSLVGPFFANRSVQTLEPSMRKLVRGVLEEGSQVGVIDLATDLAARLSTESIAELIGIHARDRALIVERANFAFTAGAALTSQPEVMVCVLELMEERRAQPADDVMTALVHGEVEGVPLTEKEILLNCENLLGASENAGLSVAAGLAALVALPEELHRLREDRALVPTAVEEMFRWASSAVHSRRTVTSPTTLADVPIGPDDAVVVWVPSANRDEAAFRDPWRFDVARQPNKHLALAAGEHSCVGASLARLQARVVLTTLLDHVESLEPAGPVEPVRSIAVRGPARVPVRVALR